MCLDLCSSSVQQHGCLELVDVLQGLHSDEACRRVTCHCMEVLSMYQLVLSVLPGCQAHALGPVRASS